MIEDDSGRRKRRSRIDPERAESDAMAEYARVLYSFAKGNSNFLETSDWTIEPYSGISGAVNLLHHPRGKELGEYTFLFKMESQQIAMENDHRRAHEGSGIAAFSDMEHMATALATLARRDVRMIFPLFGQIRTGLFLTARGYRPILLESYATQRPLPALERIFGPSR